ncbi:MAG: glycoside hydrolase family 2 [Oscillibacter sp.]|nr:glycoside hydrolase family 2 [Oscillibacter sp.]
MKETKTTGRFCGLPTPFETAAGSDWTEYPRPQLRRKAYLSLCGDWQLALRCGGKETLLGAIRVPFPPESRISGIDRPLAAGEQYVYQRNFVLPAEAAGRVLLHFGAVDQMARVLLNGQQVGQHEDGYLPFTLDITDAVRQGENTLTVEVTDELDLDLPYGKQRRKRGGMWYTPISGIWQPVWLEWVPENYIRSLRITPTLTDVTIETLGGNEEKTVTLHLPEGRQTVAFRGDCVTISIQNPIHWTPEHPHLYEFTLTDGTDVIDSYFALRTVTIQQVNGQAIICLNGKPYFFHGLLDQGYFNDGIYLPAAPEGYSWDIRTMKHLGFNMLRKHIKIEPERFYYDCDRYGMIVFQDMVNSGGYSFLLDTALPTIGLRRGISHRVSPRRKAAFARHTQAVVERLYNHPCVCYYTIFNEGWGQHDADRIYTELKTLDPTRVWDATSGWFAEQKSDVTSEHVYFKPIRLKAQPTRPLVLSEFGGYACKIEGHAFNRTKTYGYKLFARKEEFAAALEKLYRDEIIPAIRGGLCAAVLTQVSDVEDETNGLVTYDRQVVKVEEERMVALAEELQRAFAARMEEQHV